MDISPDNELQVGLVGRRAGFCADEDRGKIKTPDGPSHQSATRRGSSSPGLNFSQPLRLSGEGFRVHISAVLRPVSKLCRKRAAICLPGKRPFSIKISLAREPATITPAT